MVTRAIEDRVQAVTERLEPVGRVGSRLAGLLHRAAISSRQGRVITDVLHGSWLGHPLHAVLTDVAIGAWALGGAFDAAGRITGSDFARRTGDALTAAGIAAAVPTAVTGLTDYSTAPHPAMTTATLHGALNTGSLALYVLSLRERRGGRRGRALALSSFALAMVGLSAWLGGHLVYRHRVGVDHSERFTGPVDWTPVIDADDLPGLTPVRIEVEGKGVLLYREGNDVYAIGAVCSHAGGPLEEGRFSDTCVQCPWHDSVFDLSDGHAIHGPATQPQPVFDARMRSGRVEIRLRQG
ncbi:MAG TPA: Rieske 2Fe-2S domain-containing protein [Longimicrobiales bacterium]|nr:Rieske 2Fe-2S domain-containing protein [Longimicrobiales bacterium]